MEVDHRLFVKEERVYIGLPVYLGSILSPGPNG